MKKMIVCLAVALSVVWAGALPSRITLFQRSTLNGVELKPGEYRIHVVGDKLTLRNGKITAEAAVKSEQSNEKYRSTTIRYLNGDGKLRIAEIRVGGTNTKLTVN